MDLHTTTTTHCDNDVDNDLQQQQTYLDKDSEEQLSNFMSKLPITEKDIVEIDQKDLEVENDEQKVHIQKLSVIAQRCYITDDTPHIIQTRLGYHVLVQMNEDHSIFIYKPDGEIIKAAPWYRNSILDINSILSKQWTYAERQFDWRTNLKLLNQKQSTELRECIAKFMKEVPEEQVDLEEEDVDNIQLTFTNFILPTRQTLECFFHPTNNVRRCYPKVYKCYGHETEIFISGKYTRNSQAVICTPMEIFCDKFPRSAVSYNVDLDRKPSISQMTRLITIFELSLIHI